MPLIRLKKATPGNIVLIDFSSKHEVGKSSEKRVNPLRQKLDTYNGQRHNSLAVSTQIPISLDKFYLHSCETKKTDSLEVHNTIQSSHN